MQVMIQFSVIKRACTLARRFIEMPPRPRATGTCSLPTIRKTSPMVKQLEIFQFKIDAHGVPLLLIKCNEIFKIERMNVEWTNTVSHSRFYSKINKKNYNVITACEICSLVVLYSCMYAAFS